MTVSTEIDSEQYTGNGITTTFPYRFRILQSANMVVTRIDLSDAETVLILGTDYTITGAGGYSGGNVILSSPLPNGFGLTLVRDLPITQETDLRNQGTFFAEVHEDAFDKLTMLIQQVFSRFSLALRRNTLLSKFYDAKGYRISNMADPVNAQDAATKNYVDNREAASLSKTLRVPEDFVAELPRAEDRANKVFTWDFQGAPKASVPVSGSAADVLIELAKPNGSSLVGYTNPQSGVVESVKTALDKINVRLIYAKDFGVKADGGDDTDALWALGQFISNATDPLYVIFPRGTSRCGSQEFAGATGKGFSYRPSYFSRPWGDASDRGWFSIHRTDNYITLDMTGWTLKINAGMKQGSFNPATGAVYSPPSLPFYNYDYQAGHGFIIKFYKAPNLTVIKGKIDGNIPGAVWGGKFGDDGFQVPSYNLWVNECRGIKIDDSWSDSSPVDGIYINNGIDTTPISPLSDYTKSGFNRVKSTNCGRNCWSYTGGHDDDLNECIGLNAGSTAVGIGAHYSSPQASIDIESESGTIARMSMNDCKFTYGGLAGIQIYGPDNDISDIRITGGVAHSISGGNAIHNTARNVSLDSVKIIGSIATPTESKIRALSMRNCEIYNRVGNDYVTDFHVNGVFQEFVDCDIHYEIPNLAVTLPVINVTGNPGVGYGGSMSRFNGVTVYVSGNSANQTVQLGAIRYFRDVSVFVNSDMSGTNQVSLFMTDSSPDSFGYATNSSLINFGGSMEKRPDANVWYDSAYAMRVNNIIPAIDNKVSLGVTGQEFNKVVVNSGVQMRSPSSQKWMLSVNNSGVVTTTPVP